MKDENIRRYFERWKRKKSKKFLLQVQKQAEELAMEMFVDTVKEYDRVLKSFK